MPPVPLARLTRPRRLPAGSAARARSILAGELAAARPRDSATVVLLRDGPSGLETYTLRRQAGMAFGSGMHVFPGGSVDERDAAAGTRWAGPAPADWAARLAVSEPLATALVCAAVRETFEESGVLLAGADGGSVVADTSGGDWEADRKALLARDLAFAALLARRGLVIRTDLLRAWAHWITPYVEPKRFDTRFFVAGLPGGQATRDLLEEADAVEWVAPAAAIERWVAGQMALMPPTLVTLLELEPYGCVTDVLAAAGDRVVETVEPEVVLDGDDAALALPARVVERLAAEREGR